MAAGTITLTRNPPAVRTKETTPPPAAAAVYVFLETGSRLNFNPNQCFNTAQFILNSNQECTLITNLMASNVLTHSNNPETPLVFDDPYNQVRMCYKIRVKHPGMAVTVGEKTPLTLLLNAGCLSATPFCVTRNEWFKLYSQQDIFSKNKTSVDPPAHTAAKKRCFYK
jgi:hypothetical protein